MQRGLFTNCLALQDYFFYKKRDTSVCLTKNIGKPDFFKAPKGPLRRVFLVLRNFSHLVTVQKNITYHVKFSTCIWMQLLQICDKGVLVTMAKRESLSRTNSCIFCYSHCSAYCMWAYPLCHFSLSQWRLDFGNFFTKFSKFGLRPAV